MKKSFVFVGASNRGQMMFVNPMKAEYSEYCELLGIYDTNPGRAGEVGEPVGIPVFNDFEEMMKITRPDTVVVTTVDAYHSDYIIRALELGCDVITEKPMTIDAERCKAILEAEKKYGKQVIITFNYRLFPFSAKIKEIMNTGVIGDVFSVHFEWLLDRVMGTKAHGTSYFRRWNARMDKSGGLLVHKSTHHFDVVNWWLEQRPQTVFALGHLNLYGTPGSEKYAGGISGKNCRSCENTKICPFYKKLGDYETKMYANHEAHDGYFRDGCVFAPDIDIYDTMAVTVQYDKGAVMTYSLNATCAYEGWRIAINGSKGRLEASLIDSGPCKDEKYNTIRVFDTNNNLTEHRVAKISGEHGGGDERLRSLLFEDATRDPLGFLAGTAEGTDSVIIGAAANVSIREKRVVNIADLL